LKNGIMLLWEDKFLNTIVRFAGKNVSLTLAYQSKQGRKESFVVKNVFINPRSGKYLLLRETTNILALEKNQEWRIVICGKGGKPKSEDTFLHILGIIDTKLNTHSLWKNILAENLREVKLSTT
jgi:hypothetical protein